MRTPAASISEKLCPHAAPGVRLVAGQHRTRLVDPEGRTLHVLNGTALALWELCDGETTVTEMVAAACALFDSDKEVVRADIEHTLQQFTDAELLVWEPGPAVT